MRAVSRTVTITGYGGVEHITVETGERPHPGPGEVCVRVVAAGLNHIEAFIRRGEFRDDITDELPHGQGSDFAGIVAELGAGVAGVRKGAEVIGHAVLTAQADHVIVPAEWLVPKPERLKWEVAGGLYLMAVTATEVMRSVQIRADDTVLISAAAGAVGALETQLVKVEGATVIGGCSERNFDYLRSVGVTPVLYGDGFADRVRAAAPRGITAFLDNYGGDAVGLGAELGVPERRIATSEQRRDIEVRAIRGEVADDMKAVARVATLIADRKLDVLISGFYPLERVAEAYDDLEKRHSRGKVVIGTDVVDDSFHTLRGARVKARDLDEARP